MDSAKAWLDAVLDTGWVRRDQSLTSKDPLEFPGYKPEATGVLSASGACAGLPVEALSFDFSVLGGSMGVAAGEAVARAFDRAIARRAAVLAVTASGGARMQEGMLALSQMAATVVARTALARAGLPFVAYLRNPTTGGVYASFASLADVVWAEPGATIGFAGPRVAETITGAPLPEGSHTAEFALQRGLIDDVVQPAAVRFMLQTALEVTLGADVTAPQPAPAPEPDPDPTVSAWDAVALARHPDRPTGAGFARALVQSMVPIRGDRAGGADAGVLCALARMSGRRIGLIALDRTHPTPHGYRTAQRLIRTAGALGMPLVTFVDTPGADPSAPSEGAGVARAVADTFAAVLAHPAPVVAAVTGEGGSGGALAFAAADRVLVMQNAIFSVIGPEAAAAILRRHDIDRVADQLRLTAHDLRRFGLAERIVPEPAPGAHQHPAGAAEALAPAIAAALIEVDPAALPGSRMRRWRHAGRSWVRG